MTACEEVQWFKTKDDGRLKALSDDQLELNTYYVKQGTRFFKVFNNKEGVLSTSASAVNGSRVIPVTVNNELMIPNHYINEGVSFKSNSKIISSVNMERFKDLGYSIGLYNGQFDDTGYIYFKKSKNLVKGSSMAEFLKNMPSDDIRLISINGEKILPGMVDLESGVVPNLEGNKVYKVQLYVGTSFYEADITADTRMLKSYEYFSYDNDYITFTANGYMIFNTPNDLRSGYYFIDDAGLFRYYDYAKGSNDDAATDMNISYYEDEKSMLEAQSRQYVVDIPNKVKDLAIVVSYAGRSLTDSDHTEEVKGYVFSPDKTKYVMENDEEKHTLTLNMTEALPGEWTVNVAPKTVDIIDVKVDSTKIEEEPTLYEENIEFAEDATNVRFTCKAISAEEEDVFGYITSPEGRTYNMIYKYDTSKKEGEIYYDSPYVLSGTWTVKIYYHPTVTELGEVSTIINTITDTDVIIIGD